MISKKKKKKVEKPSEQIVQEKMLQSKRWHGKVKQSKKVYDRKKVGKVVTSNTKTEEHDEN